MKTRKSRLGKRSPRFLYELERRLRAEYGSPRHHNPDDPLDDLIFVVLSRMTQEVKYLRTYRALKQRMPTWGEVRDAPLPDVEDVIHDAGLARTKSRQIRAILKEIETREGRLDLTRLSRLPDSEVESYLTTLPGVSRKTARCVMLYALDRPTCPVDAHVWRISQRLGLAAPGSWTESRTAALEESIPVGIRASLHVTLISHGRAICRARQPLCNVCPVQDFCPRIGLKQGSERNASVSRSKA